MPQYSQRVAIIYAATGGTQDGVKDTYVAPHRQTNPDSSPRNNYNYPGNYNPNTGITTPGDQDKYLDRYNREKRDQD